MVTEAYDNATMKQVYADTGVLDSPGRNDELYSDVLDFIRDCDLREGMNVLDFGVGDGTFLSLFMDRFASLSPRLFGVDFDLSHLADKPIRAKQLDLCRFDPPFPEEFETFDLGFCIHALEHVQEARACLFSIKQLMSDKSLLYLEVPDNGLLSVETVSNCGLVHPQHVHYFSFRTLAKLLHLLDFEILRCKRAITDMIPRACFLLRRASAAEVADRIATTGKALDDLTYRVSTRIEEASRERPKIGVWAVGLNFDLMTRLNPPLRERIQEGSILLIDSSLAGKSWNGCRIIHPNEIHEHSVLTIFMTPYSLATRRSIVRQFQGLQLESVKLIDPYAT
jgi:SAM-dependent methyltransferase